MTCRHRYSDGAYVLGALSPVERAEFEQHLAGCGECAIAVGQVAPLPGLLGRVDPALLAESQSESTRLPRLLGAAADLQRRQVRSHRWRVAAVAAAAAAIAAGGVVTWTGLPGQPPPVAEQPPAAEWPATEPMSPVAAFSPVEAEVSVDRTESGSTVWMRCRYPDAGYEAAPQTFRLVAVGTDGSVEQLGSWRAGPGQQVELTGLTRFGAELDRVELQDADGATLLVHER